jgi:hydroxymethylbilane synthase
MRIGTRRSALALAQADILAGLLGDCEIVPMVTSGDRAPAGTDGTGTGGAGAGATGADGPGTDGTAGTGAEDKSRWVRELEQALLRGEIDLAVHSAKDVPGRLPEGLELLGAPPRAAVEDVLCGAAGVEELPSGATVGTSSMRRMAQLRAARTDLELVAIRGNVDTRLRKLADPREGLQAIVLARAGLQRLRLESRIGAVLDAERFVPAPGQGVIAVEGRADDAAARRAVQAITDAGALACLLAERSLALALDATCNTPLGAHAQTCGVGGLLLRAWIGLPDGSAWVADEQLGEIDAAAALGRAVAERMRTAGAAELLRSAEEMASVGGA